MVRVEAADYSWEWALARLGVFLIGLGALEITLQAGAGVLVYLPSLVLLGGAGIYATLRDRAGLLGEWAFLNWLVGGGLLGLNLFGVASSGGIGGLAWELWPAAFAFFACAWHADRRHGRLDKWLPVFLTLAVIQAVLAFGATAAVIGWLTGA